MTLINLFSILTGELTKPTSQQELNEPRQQDSGGSPGNPFDEAPFMAEPVKNVADSDVSKYPCYWLLATAALFI